MLSVESLQETITDLFEGGIGEDGYSSEEVEAMLAEINFPTLLQAVRHEMMPVYSYSYDGTSSHDIKYRGPELFGQNAVFLCEDVVEASIGSDLVTRSIELWLREDMTIVPVACVSINNEGAYLSEYRVEKECDPWQSEMEIDLEELVKEFASMCDKVLQNEYPFYEL